jgi:CBS domain-containing protein
MPSISDVFPDLFRKAKPVVSSSNPVVLAGSLLSVYGIDSLHVIEEKGKVVLGYHVLKALREVKEDQYYPLLWKPCLTIAESVKRISHDGDLSEVLDAFQGSRFGVVCVHRGEVETTIGLDEFLPLYGKGLLTTDLRVGEVASPIFRVPPHTTVGEALEHMFQRRIRRLFLDERLFISDRSIVRFIFSPEILMELRDSPGRLMGHTLAEVGPIEAIEGSGEMSVAEASGLIRPGTMDCIVCRGGGGDPLGPGRQAMDPKAIGIFTQRGGGEASG